MNIFIDIGGHLGETLAEVLSPQYRFDIVHCFEPQAKCYEHLKLKYAEQVADHKLVLHNCGLANFNGKKQLFGGVTGSLGASLFSDKNDIDNSETEICEFIRATDFINQHISPDSFAVMKLNCEGGEIFILRDLMASGAIHLLASIFIDFDIRKIPSQQAEEEKLIAEMKNCNFRNYALERETPRVKTFSFSQRRVVARALPNPIWCWLVQLKQADKIRDLTVGEKLMRVLPKFIWGRMLRIKKKICKLGCKI